MRHLRRIVLVAGLALLAGPNPVVAQQTTTVRGKVEQWSGAYGASPAPFVRVVMRSSVTARLVGKGVTDENGIFRFGAVRPGHYLLEIWTQGVKGSAIVREIDARATRYTDLPPLMAHCFDFDYPGETDTVAPGAELRARGTCRDLPDWPVKLMMSDGAGRFYPACHDIGRLAEERDGATWEADIKLEDDAAGLHAVLLTKRGLGEVLESGTERLDGLPEDSRILAGMGLHLAP